jgi:hypothetical protein
VLSRQHAEQTMLFLRKREFGKDRYIMCVA